MGNPNSEQVVEGALLLVPTETINSPLWHAPAIQSVHMPHFDLVSEELT